MSENIKKSWEYSRYVCLGLSFVTFIISFFFPNGSSEQLSILWLGRGILVGWMINFIGRILVNG